MVKGYGTYEQQMATLRKREAVLEQQTPQSYKDAGVSLANPGTLSRSASNAILGKSAGASGAAGIQVAIVRLNQRAQAGTLKPQDYQAAIAQATGTYNTQMQAQADQRRRTSVTNAASTIIGDAERRGVKGTQGIAVGTIQSDGTNTSSRGSVTSSDGRFNRITESRNINRSVTPKGTAYSVSLVEGGNQVFESVQKPIQGPPEKQNYAYSVELSEGGKKENTTLPGGSLEYLYGQPPKVYDDKRYDNLGDAAIAGFGNALRYSDAVDKGELPKPQGLEYLPYYASRGLRPLYNIPLMLMGDKNIQPTFASTTIDVPIQLVTKGKTDTHDPIGDFVKKDPLATLVEFPGEALLWVAGAKAVQLGGKAITNYSPLLYQSKKIVTGGVKPKTIYRGITWKDRPVIGIQDKKITIGFNEMKIAQSFSKVETKSLGRDGMEVALGSGIEKELIFSQRTLGQLVASKIIPKIAKERALAVKQGVIMARGIQTKIGAFGKEPIEGLTQKQSDFLLTKVVKGQTEKDIDLIHGSAALKPQLGDDITTQAGSSVKLGDLDIVPKGKDLSKTADKLIQGFAQDFPLSPGQRLSISGVGKGPITNRALELSGGKLKEPKKILEVVLKSTDDSRYGISPGKKVIGEKIPFKKSVKDTEFGIKLHTADYQLLTNVKQVLSFQKGSNTLLDIFPSSGRTKDIVRTYWNLKAKAHFKNDKELDAQADYIRSLYKGIEFTNYKPEKVLLYSSRSSSSQSVKPISIPVRPITPREAKQELKIEWNKPKSTRIISSQIKSSRLQSKIQTRSATSSIIVNSGSKIFGLIGSRIPSINPSKVPSRINPPSKIPPSLKPTISSIINPPSKIPPSLKPPTSLIPPSTKTLPPKPPGRPLSRPISITSRTKSIYKIPVRPKAGILAIILPKNTTDKTIGTKKPSHNFLGNTRVSEITGFRTRKKDIDVGDKRTKRLYNEDILKTKRSYRKSDKKNLNSLLGKPRISLRL